MASVIGNNGSLWNNVFYLFYGTGNGFIAVKAIGLMGTLLKGRTSTTFDASFVKLKLTFGITFSRDTFEGFLDG